MSLARAALQEELALAGNEAKALEELEDRVDRHGIVAFDLPGGTRETSIARALEGTLTRLRADERARLELLVATAAGSSPMSSTSVLELWKPCRCKYPW